MCIRDRKNNENNLFFDFQDVKNHPFGNNIKLFISSIDKYFKFLKNHDIYIKSQNNFPHSSGIASSASSMSCLSSCLVDIESLNSKSKDD